MESIVSSLEEDEVGREEGRKGWRKGGRKGWKRGREGEEKE